MRYCKLFLIVCILTVVSTKNYVSANIPSYEHTIYPDNHTLEQYICGNVDLRNSTLITLHAANIYTINPGNFCAIQNIQQLAIRGNSSNNLSTIQCFHNSTSRGFAFLNVKELVLENVKIIGCGDTLSDKVFGAINTTDSYFHFHQDQASVLVIDKCDSCHIKNVAIQNYTGYAIIATNSENALTMNTIRISDSWFYRCSNTNTCISSSALLGSPSYGSGILILSTTSAMINITESFLSHNYAQMVQAGTLYSSSICVENEVTTFFSQSTVTHRLIPYAGALTVLFDVQSNSSTSVVTVSKTTIAQNYGGCYGAVLAIDHNDLSFRPGSLVFQDCTFSNNFPMVYTSSQWKSYFGTTLSVNTMNSRLLYPTYQENGTETLIITDSRFNDSTRRDNGYPLISIIRFPNSVGKSIISLASVNVSTTQRVLYASSLDNGMSNSMIEVILKDISVQNPISELFLRPGTHTSGIGVFTFIDTGDVHLTGSSDQLCSFEFNIGPVFFIRGAELFLTGEIAFRNNSASQDSNGGALHFEASGYLWLVEPLSVTFESNSALSGGAVQAIGNQLQRCLFNFRTLQPYTMNNIQDIEISLTFIRNSAILAGNSIYVDALYNCDVLESSSVQIPQKNITALYAAIFKFSNVLNNGIAEVVSTPKAVCMCDSLNNLLCRMKRDQNAVDTYPGKSFFLDMQSVDDIETPVTSIVTSSLRFDFIENEDAKLFDWTLATGQDVTQLRGGNCSTLQYSVYSTGHIHHGLLNIKPMGNDQVPLTIAINLLECPPGFEQNIEGACTCIELMRINNVECDINTEYITTSDLSVWTGIVKRNSTTGVVSIGYARSCPVNYCMGLTTFNISNTSMVCQSEREGVLCGKCIEGLSIVIGSNDCVKCSNWYLFTLLVYAIAGLLLVILLFVLRLTVSSGTINGLIFYSNFVNVFLDQRYNRWSSIFISFINLEIGFPLCLYDGMNTTHKSYLSFLFPLYLWTIVGGIVLASKYSSKLVKLTSHSAVAVLATVIHLSFEKLLRTVVTGISFTSVSIQTPDGNISEKSVWYSDGNVDYNSPEHVGIVILTVLVLVVFIMPYTVLLSGVRIFERFRFANRVRPLIDAFCAPYKDKWRFWFGIRLWILILNQVFAVSVNNEGAKTLVQALILILFVLVQASIMPYKNIIVNILDLFFVTNAIVLLVCALYFTDYNDLGIVSAVLVAAVFLVFWCIIAFHAWQLLGCWTFEGHRTLPKKEKQLCSCCIKNRYMRMLNGQNELTSEMTVDSRNINIDQWVDHSYDATRLRESFLEDNAIQL